MEANKKTKDNQENTAVGTIEKPERKEKRFVAPDIRDIPNDVVEEKKKSKLGIILTITVILLLIVAIFSTIFALININNNKINKGIKIANIDVSQMTKDEAKVMLEEIYSQKAEKEIFLKNGEYETTTTYQALEVEYQIEAATKQAYEITRDGNLFKDNFNILKSWTKGFNIELDVKIDNEMLSQVTENINHSIEGAVVQASYYTENEKLIITSGKEGLKVQEEQLYKEIYNITKNEIEPQTVEIPLIVVQPDPINIEKIHQEVYKEVKDAYYTKDPFTIYLEVDGINFDIENAKKIIAEQKEKYEIPLIITKPNKTTRDIGTEASPDLLTTFSTKYSAGNANRTNNLKLAAKKINGTVLLPGEEFSYNKVVGERTRAAGFREAAVYNAGKVTTGIGGGICQISTTLYDAVIMANLDVTQRRNHQFLTGYVGGGKDATVVWGAQDFKFKNTRKYPVRIVATVEGGIATVQIWGVKEEVEYDITIESKKVATIAYTTQYIQDPNLPAGEQKVVQEGKNGSKYEAYKVVRLNGEVVSKTRLSKDTYNPMKKIVHVGTGQ